MIGSLSVWAWLQVRNPGDIEKYNDIIVHETLRVAVCDALEHNQGPPDLL